MNFDHFVKIIIILQVYMYNALALYLPGVFLGGGSSTSFSELFPSDSSAEDS